MSPTYSYAAIKPPLPSVRFSYNLPETASRLPGDSSGEETRQLPRPTLYQRQVTFDWLATRGAQLNAPGQTLISHPPDVVLEE